MSLETQAIPRILWDGSSRSSTPIRRASCGRATTFAVGDSTEGPALFEIVVSNQGVSVSPAIEAVDRLVVPTVVITEVLRRLDAQGRRAVVPDVLAHMRQGQLVPLEEQLAVAAAVLGRQHRLPLADSIIYATAQTVRGIVWTQDEDLQALPDVEYRPHRRS